MKPSERMKLLSDFLNLSPISLAIRCGLSRQRIRDIIVNDGKMVAVEIAEAINKTFPQISKEWILYGSGEMTTTINEESVVPEPEQETTPIHNNYNHTINELLSICKIQQQQISELIKEQRNLISIINDRYSIIPEHSQLASEHSPGGNNS